MTLLRLGSTIINLDNVDFFDINSDSTVTFVFYYDSLDHERDSLTISGPEAADFLAHVDHIAFTPVQLARRAKE